MYAEGSGLKQNKQLFFANCAKTQQTKQKFIKRIKK